MHESSSLGRSFSATLTLAVLALLLAGAAPLVAQPPAGYYDGVDATNGSTLRVTLHEAIDDHTRFPYTASTTDTWDIVNLADEDPNDPGAIVDIYKNASYAKIPGGVGAYNREHVWPKSYGFPNDGDGNYPYTDCHHLFAADGSYNSARSNKPFRQCNGGCSEYTTDFTDGRGGGSGVYPGNSNWTTGSFTQGTWETWDGRKGDVARAIFYMDLRYEGGFHSVTGYAEPDLILTDDEALIDGSRTGANEAVGYMGMLTVLLDWHEQDPPDSREAWRNEAVYGFQGNRNPFVDHPEWARCIYLELCSSDTVPPAAPAGLAATPGDGFVDLAWAANGEPDLGGYHVYRSTSSGGPYTRLSGSLVATTAYTDSSALNGTTYYYVVTAVDTSGNESGASNEAAATPDGPPDTTPPAAPTGLTAAAGDGSTSLDWADNGEPDLDGYHVYRSTTGGGPYTRVNAGLVGASAYTDAGLVNGTTYYYVVTAVDTSGNESADSGEASATPQVPVTPQVVLSEVFYDASGADDGLEWVELFNAGSTAVDLSAWSLGNGGTDYTYSTVQLSGTLQPGATFVVGGPTSSAANGNPIFDLAVNFGPDFQNSGTAGDGVALFDVPAVQITAATVPVDAVVYGPDNANGLIDETGVANAPEVGNAGPGSSIERLDLAGSWQIQGAPTPNSTPLGSPPGNAAPTVTITGPADGSTFDQGVAIDFTGTASDPEDGDLSATLSWTSDLDGAIGSGASFTTSALSVGTHTVSASATDSGGLGGTAAITVTVQPPPGGDVTSHATADFLTQNGTIGGSYDDTHASDGVYQTLTEGESGGKPSKRYSLADHIWTFQVPAAASYTFHVEAHHDPNAEGDDFQLYYSKDDVEYWPMLLITKTADDDTAQSYAFPEDVAGTLYVRALDTDTTPGNIGLDTLYVDRMWVLGSGSGGPPPTAPTSFHVAAIDLSTAGGGNVKGQAVVSVVDDQGNPASGVQVTGTFSGAFAETHSGTTDVAGRVTLTTDARERTPVSFGFCVDAASHASLSYDAAANVETCDGF